MAERVQNLAEQGKAISISEMMDSLMQGKENQAYLPLSPPKSDPLRTIDLAVRDASKRHKKDSNRDRTKPKLVYWRDIDDADVPLSADEGIETDNVRKSVTITLDRDKKPIERKIISTISKPKAKSKIAVNKPIITSVSRSTSSRKLMRNDATQTNISTSSSSKPITFKDLSETDRQKLVTLVEQLAFAQQHLTDLEQQLDTEKQGRTEEVRHRTHIERESEHRLLETKRKYEKCILLLKRYMKMIRLLKAERQRYRQSKDTLSGAVSNASVNQNPEWVTSETLTVANNEEQILSALQSFTAPVAPPVPRVSTALQTVEVETRATSPLSSQTVHETGTQTQQLSPEIPQTQSIPQSPPITIARDPFCSLLDADQCSNEWTASYSRSSMCCSVLDVVKSLPNMAESRNYSNLPSIADSRIKSKERPRKFTAKESGYSVTEADMEALIKRLNGHL